MQAKLGGLSSRRRYDEVAVPVTSASRGSTCHVKPVRMTDAPLHRRVDSLTFVLELFEQGDHDEVARARMKGGLDDVRRFPDPRGCSQGPYFHRILANGSTMHDATPIRAVCACLDSYALAAKITSRVRLWAAPVPSGPRRWRGSRTTSSRPGRRTHRHPGGRRCTRHA